MASSGADVRSVVVIGRWRSPANVAASAPVLEGGVLISPMPGIDTDQARILHLGTAHGPGVCDRRSGLSRVRFADEAHLRDHRSGGRCALPGVCRPTALSPTHQPCTSATCLFMLVTLKRNAIPCAIEERAPARIESWINHQPGGKETLYPAGLGLAKHQL